MKTRIVHTKIWQDDYFVNLSFQEKVLFLYLISNEYIMLFKKIHMKCNLL